VIDTAQQTSAELDDERRGHRRAWFRYTWGMHAFPTTVLAVFLGPFLTDTANNAAVHGHVQALGLSIRAGSFYPFTVTAAVIIELCVLPLLGALADITGRRRLLLTVCMVVGAAATLGFATVTGKAYLWGGVLFLIANTGYGGADALNNGYLPQLSTPDERDALSSRGWAIGYLGGFVLLALDLGVYLGHKALGMSQTEAARLALASAGAWWLIFGFSALRGLPGRSAGRGEASGGGRSAASASLRQLGATLRELASNRSGLVFLVAFILYNEGVQTVISFASTYATKGLGLTLTTTIEAILIIQPVAFAGALWLGRLAARFGPRRTVIGSLGVWVLLLLTATGLQAGAAWQFLALGVGIGVVLGGSQALSRSLFSQIVPRGREAEYFGLYEISQNGTAWIGSLVVGLTYNWTGSYRLAISSLVLFFLAGTALLARTDLARAIRAAGNPVPQRI
jgi:MFS transporter, UMF1 family